MKDKVVIEPLIYIHAFSFLDHKPVKARTKLLFLNNNDTFDTNDEKVFKNNCSAS